MGAIEFNYQSNGKTAQEAFDRINQDGDLDKKSGIKMFKLPDGADLETYVDDLIGEEDSIGGKDSPAGCIEIPNSDPTREIKRFVFFGWVEY